MNKEYLELLRTELARVSSGREPSPGFTEQAAAVVTQHALAPAPITFATGTPVQAQPLPWEPRLEDLPAAQPRTAAAEQFRRLRSRLLEYRTNQPLKTLLINSALPKEGKSFTAANLAIALNNHRGTRVLLIDADLRRYSLQEYFGTVHRPGLADYLVGDVDADAIMQRADAQTLENYPTLGNLTLIAGGGKSDQIADLSQDRRFAELIAYASPMFEWIIVDSSPITLVSDAANLARHCDGVLLVVRSGVTPYPAAQKAQSELQAANILGVVLNGVDDNPLPSYYGYGSDEN